MNRVFSSFPKASNNRACILIKVPLGIMLDEARPDESKCIRCSTCDGFPCLVKAKSDAQVCCVEPALQYPNVMMLTNAYVSKLGTSASGTRDHGGTRGA